MKKSEKHFQLLTVIVASLFSVMPIKSDAQTNAKPKAKNEKSQGKMADATATAGPALTLEAYLGQVATQNESYRAAELSEEGATLRSDEYTLLTKPNLIANAAYSDDQRDPGQSLAPQRTRATAYTLGVQQQTSFGLGAALKYNYTDTNLTYSAATAGSGFASALPAPNFFVTGPVLELTQSFGKNGFGSETRANQELLSAQALAAKYDASFRKTQLRSDAEGVFWRLALAREAVELSKENIERARRIQDLNKSRARLQLSDRADVLQSDANLYQRELELQNAVDEERSASRAFNTFRGVNGDTVTETLPVLDRELKLVVPERKEMRDDLKAANERRRAAVAQTKLAGERNRPTIDAFANLGLNGRDVSSGSAVSESFGTNHPNYQVGVRVTMPLDLKTLGNNRDGYRKEEVAAETSYRRTAFENDRLWNDLNKRLVETQERLRLARRIEVAQREKLDYERDRQRRGRSTTFTVIQFEQELANAQLTRIRNQTEVLNIFAQLKTFGGGQ